MADCEPTAFWNPAQLFATSLSQPFPQLCIISQLQRLTIWNGEPVLTPSSPPEEVLDNFLESTGIAHSVELKISLFTPNPATSFVVTLLESLEAGLLKKCVAKINLYVSSRIIHRRYGNTVRVLTVTIALSFVPLAKVVEHVHL